LAMSYQMGLFEEPAWPDGEPAQAAAEVSATARPGFPEDLAPACSGKPVAEARAYRAASGPHPLAFFDGSGKLHAAWQCGFPEKATPRELRAVAAVEKIFEFFPDWLWQMGVAIC
jgi:hypothetical protein